MVSSGYLQKRRSRRSLYVSHICLESSAGIPRIVATMSLLIHTGSHHGCRAVCSRLSCFAIFASPSSTALFPFELRPSAGSSWYTMSCLLEQYSCRVQTRCNQPSEKNNHESEGPARAASLQPVFPDHQSLPLPEYPPPLRACVCVCVRARNQFFAYVEVNVSRFTLSAAAPLTWW